MIKSFVFNGHFRLILVVVALWGALSLVSCGGGSGGGESQDGEMLLVVTVDEKYGFIDTTGKFVIEPQFEEAYEFSEGVAPVQTDSGLYYIDKTGKVAIVPQSLDTFKIGLMFPFHEGLAAVSNYDRNLKNPKPTTEGYIDKTGEIVIAPRFRSAEPFKDGLARASVVVDRVAKYGYINRKGEWVIAPQFTNADDFYEGLARVMTGDEYSGEYGYIDKKGRFVVEPQYEDAWRFSEGMAAVKKDGKYGYIDKKGRYVNSLRFDEAAPFSEGLAAVSVDGEDYFIDKSFKIAVRPHYGDNQHVNLDFSNTFSCSQLAVSSFSEGLAVAMVSNDDGDFYYGYIDKSGEFVIDANYTTADPFCNGIAIISFRDIVAYINKAGKHIRKVVE